MLAADPLPAGRVNLSIRQSGAIVFLLGMALCTALRAQPASLTGLINAYRAAPPPCDGRPSRRVAALATPAALARVQLGAGMLLDQVIERAGYPVARAKAISIAGASDAAMAMDMLAQTYCRTLLSTQYAAVGAGRSGNNWLIVFAQPAPPPAVLLLPNLDDAGLAVLAAVNTARASPARCGEHDFEAAAPLAWNGALGEAALAHSQDMALQRYFSHQDKDGGTVAERALGAGYRWRRIGENIAFGQESAAEVVAGWMASPGHCANIMNPHFTDMGAAYTIDTRGELPRAYWTQVFGTPR